MDVVRQSVESQSAAKLPEKFVVVVLLFLFVVVFRGWDCFCFCLFFARVVSAPREGEGGNSAQI